MSRSGLSTFWTSSQKLVRVEGEFLRSASSELRSIREVGLAIYVVAFWGVNECRYLTRFLPV